MRTHPALLLSFLLGACAVSDDAALPGSLEGSRVAIDTRGGSEELVFLARNLPAAAADQLREAAPNVRIVTGLSPEEAIERATEFHGADARYASPSFLMRAARLRWLQAMSAGVDRYVSIPGLAQRTEIVFTNMAGVHGPAIADHVFAMLLALTRDMRGVLDSARGASWSVVPGPMTPTTLEGRTLFVVGLGGIGNQVARRGHGFGMRVVATKRTLGTTPPWVDELGSPDATDRFLAEADVVAICLPLTEETHGMFDAKALARLPRGAILVNVGRGAIVDTDALVEALESGHLAGACLDVTDPEPLPPEHRLWQLPQVIITPHSSSRAALTGTRRMALLVENMRRFGAGEGLLNVVDPRRGY